MYWFVSFLLLELLLEGVLSHGSSNLTPRLRKFSSAWAGLLLVGVTAGLCLVAWQTWIWSVPIVVYRLVNLARIYQSRLPAQQLRTVSSRALNWLLIAQVLVTALAWLAVRHDFGVQVLNVLVGLQLLSGLVLLRATLHTWRHAGAPNDRTVTLTDKELPSVSVLIPARNETDDLKRCLEHMIASDYPKLEVIVYDDCSTGRHTPEVIKSFAHAGVRFIPGDVPDESRWLAKNYAYERLSQEASGQVLMFCGVDTVFEPHSIRQLVFLMTQRGKDMLSVMPLRLSHPNGGSSILQSMRYFWEMCLPRRFFKRPPVLSTCWLIRSEVLKRMGGFESVSRSVNPEAPLARKAVTTDAYSFIRSDSAMGIYSNKHTDAQYATSVRVRYPQLHRRLELVALVAVFDLVLLVGPFIGLAFARFIPHSMAYVLIWAVCLMCLLTAYGIVAGGARLTNVWVGWLMAPIAFLVDLLVLHISLWKYEFSTVTWKGRNVCVPVMQVIPRLPKMKD